MVFSLLPIVCRSCCFSSLKMEKLCNKVVAACVQNYLKNFQKTIFTSFQKTFDFREKNANMFLILQYFLLILKHCAKYYLDSSSSSLGLLTLSTINITQHSRTTNNTTSQSIYLPPPPL